MSKLRNLLCVAAFSAMVAAGADTLDIESAAADAPQSRPTRGMTQASVESRFGSPMDKIAAVGDPPIARWEYPGFIVYFEYDRVIHSVVKR